MLIIGRIRTDRNEEFEEKPPKENCLFRVVEEDLKELEIERKKSIHKHRELSVSATESSCLEKELFGPTFCFSLSLCFFYGILHRLMVGTFLSAYNPPQKLFFRYFFPVWKNPFFVFVFLSPFFCSCFLGVSYSLRDFSLPLNYAQWQQQQSVVSSIFISVRAKEF